MTLCMSVPPGPSPVLIKLHVGRVILAPVSFPGEITVRVGHTHLHDSLRGSLLFDWLIDLYIVLGVFGIHLLSVRTIGLTGGGGEPYGQLCGSIFHSLYMFSSKSIIWGDNFWKGKEPTDPTVYTQNFTGMFSLHASEVFADIE